MVSLTENPYRPGVGLQPAYLAGRDREQRRFVSILGASPGIPANVRVTGLRGVGKTVLLQRLREIGEEQGWATTYAELQPKHNAELALTDLFSRLMDESNKRLSRSARIRARIDDAVFTARKAVQITYEGMSWGVGGDLTEDVLEIGQLLVDGLKQAQAHGRAGLVLLLDEAQVLSDDKKAGGSQPLSTLLSAVAALQREGAPLALVLCGLPTLTVNLLNARTYSERMFQGFEVSSLDEAEAIKAFIEPLRESPLTADDALVTRVTAAVNGYPYFIQLWGAELWDATREADLRSFTIATLDLIEADIYKRLDLDFYEPRVEALTPAEQDLLVDSASCQYPPILVAELNAVSPKSSENVNVLLGRLVKANVMFRVRKGQYMFTAPGFRDFLARRVRSIGPPDSPSPRLSLSTYEQATAAAPSDLLHSLVTQLGAEAVGHAAGLDGPIPAHWLYPESDSEAPAIDATARLQVLHRVTVILAGTLENGAAIAWLLKPADSLGEAPLDSLRRGRFRDVLQAASEAVAEV